MKKISIFSKLVSLKLTFLRHTTLLVLVITNVSLANQSLASTSTYENLKQELQEEHEKRWKDKVDYAMANELITCGKLNFKLNRTIEQLKEAEDTYQEYKYSNSYDAVPMLGLAKSSILRLRNKVNEEGPRFESSCSNLSTNMQTWHHVCQSRDVKNMAHEACAAALTARYDYDEKFREHFAL
ncbi:MAG: hypothetical protein ABJK64_14175 [Paraglaciecola sp.]|uniref:hypothetical protein n=1 Tax=Paraglaciecola sp. TaxID=1920173 RepID=UPI003296CBC5